MDEEEGAGSTPPFGRSRAMGLDPSRPVLNIPG